MQDAFFAAASSVTNFKILIGLRRAGHAGLYSFRIVHSASGSKIVPVSRIDECRALQPAELDWVAAWRGAIRT